ncbi:hypothetical protein [Cellulomonas sp. ICMP 17802]|uniref:hypothetical protein n=1 Tax=Cellulomonas sp. ICMP 17802 TaxID=3239199 RepID=UPI00351B7C68
MRTPLAIVAVVALAAGCASGERPEPYDDAADCNHLYTRGDPGLGAGFGYSEEPHPFGTPVPVTVCVPGGGGTVRLWAEGSGVTITPEAGWAPEGGPSGLSQVAFEITVEPGAAAGLRVEATGMSYGGPGVVTDDEAGTWRLDVWGDRYFDRRHP